MVSMTKASFRDPLERTAGFTTQVLVFKKTGVTITALLTTIKPRTEKALFPGLRC